MGPRSGSAAALPDLSTNLSTLEFMRSLQQAKHDATHETTEAGIAALPSPTSGNTIQRIALNQLSLAPGSRRNMSRRSIQLLAERIHTADRLQSLMVVPGEGSRYYVVAGDRRFAALQLLAGDNRISQTFPVPCRVISGKATSQTEVAADAELVAGVPGPKRRRFLDLRNRCPGLLTGSELAARRC